MKTNGDVDTHVYLGEICEGQPVEIGVVPKAFYTHFALKFNDEPVTRGCRTVEVDEHDTEVGARATGRPKVRARVFFESSVSLVFSAFVRPCWVISGYGLCKIYAFQSRLLESA